MPTSQPTLLSLFLVFTRIGLTSFGGGLSGWLFREFVQDRKWIGEEEFLNGLSLSQALPGINVTNLAIWIGYRVLGGYGAVVGFAGIVIPPAAVILLLGTIFAHLSQYPLTQVILIGASAASIGLSLSMGITAVRRLPRRLVPIVMSISTFAAAGLARLPLIWVVLIAGGISVSLEYMRLSKDRGDHEQSH